MARNPDGSIINLGNWDFNQYGMSGGRKGGGARVYGQADFEKLKSMGANNAQLSLLGGVANKQGVRIGQWVSDNLPSGNPWAYAKHGAWGMGMQDINAALGSEYNRSINDVRGYVKHALDNDIAVGSAGMDWYRDNDPANIDEDQIRADAQAEMTSNLEEWKKEFETAQALTIQRSGNPGAVGKPAEGIKIAQGDDYSGRKRRGLNTLNRDSNYFMNNLGGVASGAANTLNIA